jgi:two-component system, NtrC family, nitrogen regulation sensor histidine kinase NtrY
VKVSYSGRLTLFAALAALPGVTASLGLLLVSSYLWWIRVGAAIALLAASISLVVLLRNRIVRPLQTVSNVLAALREDDFSIRARSVSADDALGHVMLEVNALAETLRTERLGAQEATALLRAVIAEIDVAIFAFDAAHRLVLANRYGERLLRKEAVELLGRSAEELGLRPALQSDSSLQDLTFPGGSGRYDIRRTKFWQGGAPHELLVMSDLSDTLREQEREAWKRLIRVIGHELNNSLAPIKSIAGSLESLLKRDPPPDEWQMDMRQGLGIIAARADALSRFTGAYARLARLPPPTRKPVDFAALMQRVVALESRFSVCVQSGPPMVVDVDADQIEQLLINVVRNAVDAAMETGGRVETGWMRREHSLEVWVDDEGPGVPSTANLFVPFFTTKSGGSGIGLALSRQIAEGHGGSLDVQNRADRQGVRATFRLPL